MCQMTEESEDLATYMSELSELAFCASWMDSLEYTLWCFTRHGPGQYGLLEITTEIIAKLKALSDACGGWIWWDENADECETWVSLEKWEEMYQKEMQWEESK